ncbi:MAG TPA: hypothetical protein VL261_07455 [Nitrospira sp.]|jgi:hypothetical protein|nr:hypothetical protein [Nitrospira sp.]
MRERLVLEQRVLNVTVSLMVIVVVWSMFPLTFLERAVALEQPAAQLEVTGTLAKLDLSAGKGMLMTDLQKPIFFRLDRPELFERLSIGDRVTMQLDEEGRVLKVIETLPAEVHEPPPPAK